ncbi:MAG: pyrophosphatase [Gammaproteobacteria bacterium]|nr:pyrophosphatase [Gammaproteobacteria bacterium]
MSQFSYQDYCGKAAGTDRLVGKPDHLRLLAMGMFGEVGGIAAELKKRRREGAAYAARQQLLLEEVGDVLWYMGRLFSLISPHSIPGLTELKLTKVQSTDGILLTASLCSVAAEVLKAVVDGDDLRTTKTLVSAWKSLREFCLCMEIDIARAAEMNIEKTSGRWRQSAEFYPLFDHGFPEEETLPRQLKIEFKETGGGGRTSVILRYGKVNLGDRLTDNISQGDYYRFHDVFHLAYAVFLGWSPVTRSLLHCKRKSDPGIDENEDGARAAIVEEAISATIFSHAVRMSLYEGVDSIDSNLLKLIVQLVQGYEVDRLPMWQWEIAILEGFRVFRQMRKNRGGVVTLDLEKRDLGYDAPSAS